MAAFKSDDRVGSNVKPTLAPKPSPTPTPTPTRSSSTFNPLNVKQHLEELTGVKLSTAAGTYGAGEPLIDSLSSSQKTTLVKLMKKLGYNISSSSELKTALNGYYPDIYNKATSFENLYSMLAADYIPGASAAPATGLPTQTVTQYSDAQLKDISNAIAQNFLKRNLEPTEWETIAPQLRKLVEKGTTTTTQKVGGKNVVTVTPGFSQEAAKTIVEKQLKTSAVDDLKVKQYQDFTDWLSQNMAGM